HLQGYHDSEVRADEGPPTHPHEIAVLAPRPPMLPKKEASKGATHDQEQPCKVHGNRPSGLWMRRLVWHYFAPIQNESTDLLAERPARTQQREGNERNRPDVGRENGSWGERKSPFAR